MMWHAIIGSDVCLRFMPCGCIWLARICEW